MPESARSISELVDKGVRFLTRTLKGGDRAMVVLIENGQPVLKGAQGVEGLEADSLAAEVLSRCHRSAKPVLILNAQRDPEYRGHASQGELMSALCVPVTPGHSPRVLGMLFVDNHLKPGTFTYLDRATAEHFAREMGRRLVVLQKLPQAERRRRAATIAAEVILGGSCIALGLLWGFGGIFLGGGRSGPVERATPARQLETAEPDRVALSFLNVLNLDQLEQAYWLLSTRLKKELPRTKFEEAIKAWLSQDVNRWELRHRTVALGERRDTLVTVYVEPAPQGGKRWTWYLVREPNGWKVDRLNGGPLD